jgi:hypothetical protein
MPFLRFAPWIGAGLLVLAVIFAVSQHFSRDDEMRDKITRYEQWGGQVIVATREASGNEDMGAKQVVGQIVALGNSNRSLKVALDNQTEAVNKLAQEAVRLRAEASELRKIADRAKAQRQAALDRLSDLSITPGTREDCLTLLSEANEALDLIYSSGV